MIRHKSFFKKALALTLTTVSVCGLLVSVSNAQSSYSLDARGRTNVELSNHQMIITMSNIGISLSTLGLAHIQQSGLISFPTTGGLFDVSAGEGSIMSAGGLYVYDSVTHNAVAFTDFQMEMYKDAPCNISALTSYNGTYVGRTKLFHMHFGSALAPVNVNRKGGFKLTWIGLSLHKDAAATLNRAFQIGNFTDGMDAGLIQKARAFILTAAFGQQSALKANIPKENKK